MITAIPATLHIMNPNLVKVYLESPFGSLKDFAYFIASNLMYFVWIDLWSYLVHRALHLPFLYKNVHKIHHSWV